MADQTDELRDAQADLDAAAERVAKLADQEIAAGMALERAGGLKDAAVMKAELERVTGEVQREQAKLTRAGERVSRELNRQMDKMKTDLERRMGAVSSALEPVRKRIELMQEGIETLGLYLSAAEGLVTVIDGEHADELEPIVIRQLVLALDEETQLFAEEGGVVNDAEDMGYVDEWLRADPEHVAQIVPERRCVVACVARWRERVRDDWRTHAREDVITHFIVRNGDAVYRTAVKDFSAGKVLVPRADEFVKHFKRRQHNFTTHRDDWVAIKPGTREWREAEEKADKRGRDFLRIGLILQGLVDNSDVFAPLHPAGIDMLTDPAERSEKVRIVADAEGGLESGREPFLEMQTRLNATLRPGMRIIGAFDGHLFADANDWAGERSHRHGHSRCHPTGWNWAKPPSGVPLVIEDRRADGGLVVRYERDDIYDPRMRTYVEDERPGRWYIEGGRRKSKTRASVTLYPSDKFILPYDMVDAEALEACLRSRRDRKDYQDVWPLIKATMFAKRAEERAEAPFLEMLRGVCARENSEMPTERETYELGQWFKLKNKHHRPLVISAQEDWDIAKKNGEEPEIDPWMTELIDPDTGERHMSGAVRMIVAEHARRIADRHRRVDPEVLAALRQEYPEALLIGRPRRGGYIVLLAAHPTDNVFVHELEFSAKGELKERKDWRLIGSDRPTRWTITHTHPRWAEWDLAASDRDHLRGPEVDAIVERMRHTAREGERLMLVSMRGGRRSTFLAWALQPDDREEPVDRVGRRRHSNSAPVGMKYVAREFYWTRRGDGGIDTHRGVGDGWGSSDHTWVEWPQGGPWKGNYASSYAKTILWGPDAALVAEWDAALQVHEERTAAGDDREERVRELGGSIRGQWRIRQFHGRLASFLEQFPDGTLEEWEAHELSSAPQWPGNWPYQNSHHESMGGIAVVVSWLLDRDIDPEGMTVEEAYELAREHDLPDTVASFLGARQGTDAFEMAVPEDCLAFVFGEEPGEGPDLSVLPREAEPEPEEDEYPDVLEELDDGVQVLVREEDAKPKGDVFDDLRDAIGGLTND